MIGNETQSANGRIALPGLERISGRNELLWWPWWRPWLWPWLWPLARGTWPWSLGLRPRHWAPSQGPGIPRHGHSHSHYDHDGGRCGGHGGRTAPSERTTMSTTRMRGNDKIDDRDQDKHKSDNNAKGKTDEEDNDFDNNDDDDDDDHTNTTDAKG